MARLIVTVDDVRTEYEVLPLTTIGRQPDATVPLLDEQVSKHHCQVVALEEGRFILRDCQSRNGTWMRGTKVSERELVNGDEFIVGKAIIKLVGAQPPSMAGATRHFASETAKALDTQGDPDDSQPDSADDALRISHRVAEGFQRLLVRFNELGGLVAAMSNRSSGIDSRMRTVDETSARMGESILALERMVREVWGQVARLGESLESHEQRMQDLARDQADLRRELAALGLPVRDSSEPLSRITPLPAARPSPTLPPPAAPAPKV